jgi:hypothetical protein
MAIALRDHGRVLMAEQVGDFQQDHAARNQARGDGVVKVMDPVARNPGRLARRRPSLVDPVLIEWATVEGLED